MKAIAMKLISQKQNLKQNIPVTPRGRALHTVDWFLNGRPVLNNHDNPRLSLKNGLSC